MIYFGCIDYRRSPPADPGRKPSGSDVCQYGSCSTAHLALTAASQPHGNAVQSRQLVTDTSSLACIAEVAAAVLLWRVGDGRVVARRVR